MIYRTLQAQEVPQWAAHCQSVFQLEDANYFRRHYDADPYADPAWIFVAVDGEEIVSTVRVFRRPLWIDGQRVEMGGIGEVSTKPDYRGQGLAGELLRMAIAEMTAQRIAVSILFGDRPMYAAAGWARCVGEDMRLPVDGLPTLDETAEVKPFAITDLPSLMGIYDLYAGRLDGAIIRTEAYWQRWVLPQWRPPHVFWQAGQPVAYACVRGRPDGGLDIAELCAAPQAEEMLPGFLRRLADEARAAAVYCPSALLSQDVPGERLSTAGHMMIRLNIPWGEWETTDALVRGMRHPGMFAVDGF